MSIYLDFGSCVVKFVTPNVHFNDPFHFVTTNVRFNNAPFKFVTTNVHFNDPFLSFFPELSALQNARIPTSCMLQADRLAVQRVAQVPHGQCRGDVFTRDRGQKLCPHYTWRRIQ